MHLIRELVDAEGVVGCTPNTRERIRRRDRGGGLALHPLQRRRPEVEEGRPEAGLRLDRLLGVDEPVLGDLAEGRGPRRRAGAMREVEFWV